MRKLTQVPAVLDGVTGTAIDAAEIAAGSRIGPAAAAAWLVVVVASALAACAPGASVPRRWYRRACLAFVRSSYVAPESMAA